MTSDDHLEFLRKSFDEFLLAYRGSLEPDLPHLTYEFPYIKAAKWSMMADAMILDELREVTNRLHEWHHMLRRWQAWNMVVTGKDQMQSWDLRREFMDPLMHVCLLNPSSIRDVLTFTATNAFHQIRLHVEPGYKDVLEGDACPSEPKPRPLSRRRKEARLANLALAIPGASTFIKLLRGVDDSQYREVTSDYRNANSHAIGPRLALGQTRMVTRHSVPATRMETQADGTGRVVQIPGTYTASYSFGGVEPLDIEEARKSNLKQYKIARSCFDSYTEILQQNAAKLPRTDA